MQMTAAMAPALTDASVRDAATEEWRPIPGSDGHYSVSDRGRIRSEPMSVTRGRKRGRVLACYPDGKGYIQFKMCVPGRRPVTMKVHRAVALAFLGPRPPGHQVNHRSGDKRDNSVVNLEYVTCRENVRHSWDAGLCGVEHRRGERNNLAKLTAEDVRVIRRMHGAMSMAGLAKRFDVSKQCIAHVVKRKTWRHVA